jgi:hypothetical protein
MTTTETMDDAMQNGVGTCDGCGQETPFDLLDGVVTPDGCDAGQLKCPACYGPGYAPFLDAQWPVAITLAAARGVTLEGPPHARH